MPVWVVFLHTQGSVLTHFHHSRLQGLLPGAAASAVLTRSLWLPVSSPSGLVFVLGLFPGYSSGRRAVSRLPPWGPRGFFGFVRCGFAGPPGAVSSPVSPSRAWLQTLRPQTSFRVPVSSPRLESRGSLARLSWPRGLCPFRFLSPPRDDPLVCLEGADPAATVSSCCVPAQRAVAPILYFSALEVPSAPPAPPAPAENGFASSPAPRGAHAVTATVGPRPAAHAGCPVPRCLVPVLVLHVSPLGASPGPGGVPGRMFVFFLCRAGGRPPAGGGGGGLSSPLPASVLFHFSVVWDLHFPSPFALRPQKYSHGSELRSTVQGMCLPQLPLCSAVRPPHSASPA